MDTTQQDRERAEHEIFTLRRKMRLHLIAGDTQAVDRIARQIAKLQIDHGALYGVGKDTPDERTV